MASKDLQLLFNVLKLNVNFFLDALKIEGTGAELHKALHDDQTLPDKQTAAMASETVNLLRKVEQLLEPGHLVLADHFLGIVAQHRCKMSAYYMLLTQPIRLHQY